MTSSATPHHHHPDRGRPAPRSIRARAGVSLGVLVAAVALVTASCGASGGSDEAAKATTTTTPARTTTTADAATTTTGDGSSDGTDGHADGSFECPSAAAVGKVLGTAVDQASSSGGQGGTGVSYSYQGCAYRPDDASFRVTVVQLASQGPLDVGLYTALDDEAKEDGDHYQRTSVADHDAFDTGDELTVDDGAEGSGDSPIRVTTDDVTDDAQAAYGYRIHLAELVLGT